ncbi:hypothetical protein [Brevundimonas sp.]|uniref:hypothetical protein n=1 Tax=Brevundimonas sp. TaxID=1871086 RepID=UPI002D6031B4|nr:hypothetical protein [Brevundimonas sp.]HYC66874.1 hypothetical protein [Brevundimonas sp.]
MRERHNIVGSEVGHARPPIYFRAGLPRRSRRRSGRLLLAALVLLLLAGVALVALERGAADETAGRFEAWGMADTAVTPD